MKRWTNCSCSWCSSNKQQTTSDRSGNSRGQSHHSQTKHASLLSEPEVGNYITSPPHTYKIFYISSFVTSNISEKGKLFYIKSDVAYLCDARASKRYSFNLYVYSLPVTLMRTPRNQWTHKGRLPGSSMSTGRRKLSIWSIILSRLASLLTSHRSESSLQHSSILVRRLAATRFLWRK